MKPYFADGPVTLYHGRAEDILPTLDAVDLLLTDPPYGIGEARGRNKSRTKLAKATDYGNAEWDNAPPSAELLALARSRATWQIIFGGNYFDLPPARCWLVWDKENGRNDFADAELAWTNLDRAVRLKRHRWAGMLRARPEERFHPTQKPLDVMRWCLSLAPDVGSVIDPFCGSGTTLVAARERGLTSVGIEQHEPFCEVAARRLAQRELFEARP